MTTTDLIAADVAPLVAYLTEHYPVEDILLFGSRARGDWRAESDWDVIVLLGDDAPSETVDALLADPVPGSFFTDYLDLFVLMPTGSWLRPGDTVAEPHSSGWFPYSSAWDAGIKADAKSVLR